MLSVQMKWWGIVVSVAGLSACAPVPEKKAALPDPVPQCQAARSESGLIGNWLGSRKSPGLAGELKVWLQLHPNGKMAYSEQLQRRGKPPQLLSEDGCWRVEGDVLVLQTLNSNGSPVEADDPIYTNHYQVVSQTGRQLRLRSPEGAFTVGRMPDNYRLPF